MINAWRRKEALKRTWQRRPDLIDKMVLTEEDQKFLREEMQRDAEGHSR